VLNAARDALHRYELLQSLNQSGRNDFRAHRADGPLDTIRFPVFVRLADEHTGSLTPLLYDRAALQRAFAYLWLRRLPLRHLLVTEFCETASADGFYRKYSIFRIGDAYIPRHLLIGRHWMTKGETRETDETLISEEMTYLRENPRFFKRRTSNMDASTTASAMAARKPGRSTSRRYWREIRIQLAPHQASG
jgi:hypothetical protein